MMRFRTSLLSATALALVGAGAAHAQDGVVASIKPVHSLVAAVMKGVGEPSLIISGAGSPHTYSLRPSEARAIEGASLVFWIGPDLEMFLRGPLETLAGNAKVVELGKADGLTLLPYREGGPFESHDHAHDHEAGESDHDHGHDHENADHADADDHAHDDDGHDHAHESAHDDDDGHDHDHGSAHDDDDHDHGAHDAHLWLDPENARIFVGEIETALADADPDNAATYARNAAATIERLDALIGETRAALEAVDNKGFVVFHDAYQYYENRFDFRAAGSITVSPEIMPGAQRLGEIRDRIRELGVACVFSEPQFEPRLVSVVMEGTEARAGVLDPYGADLPEGPDAYFEAIGDLTTSLTQCLDGNS